jgi:acylphosphatase
MPVVARHLSICGKVQGVSYRDWTLDTATELGLAGWVRNRMDGSVEAFVQGEPAAIDAFVMHAHEGPPAARVARIETKDAAFDADITGFDRRTTV